MKFTKSGNGIKKNLKIWNGKSVPSLITQKFNIFNVLFFFTFQDGIGEFFADNDTKVYWVSFLDGMQRVLLFSQDLALVTVAQQVWSIYFCLPPVTTTHAKNTSLMRRYAYS